ncbi:hypothetical protein V6N13_126722 [Hibiscus sabdariffa]
MDVSKAVVMDLNNAIETVLLASSPIVVPPAPLSTLFYKDTLLASGFAGSQPVVDTIDDEEVILLEGNVARSNVDADANSHAATAIIAIGAVAPSDPMVAPISISSPMVVCDAVFAPPSSNSPTPQSWRSSAVSTSKTTTLTSRPSSTLSFARFALFPRLSSKFNKANHTAIVFEENADPNVHTPAPNNLPLPPNATMVAPLDPPLSREMVSASCDNGGNLLNGVLLWHPNFLKDVKQYIRDSRPFLLGIVEPNISGARTGSVIAALGFHSSHRIKAVGFACGLWLCWHESLCVEVLRKVLWPHLRSLAYSIREPWLFMCDFNATLDASKRKGGTDAVLPSRDFQSFLFDCGLWDMGYQGPDFSSFLTLTSIAWFRIIGSSFLLSESIKAFTAAAEGVFLLCHNMI